MKAQAAKVDPIALTTTLRQNNYKLEQASVDLIEGALGKDHLAAERESDLNRVSPRGLTCSIN